VLKQVNKPVDGVRVIIAEPAVSGAERLGNDDLGHELTICCRLYCVKPISVGEASRKDKAVGRVEDRRGGVQAALGCIRRFRLRARLERTITPFPAPATSNRTGGFPASGSPRRRHPSGLWVPSASARFHGRVCDAVVLEETPRSVYDAVTPPLPAESLALASLAMRRDGLRPLAYLCSKLLQTDGGLYHPAPALPLCSDCLR